MFDPKDIKNSALEAIYWWNRTEDYYYKYFSKLDQLYKNTDLFQFFSSKLFEVFLREYAIRRNIAAANNSVEEFLTYLMKNDFFDQVNAGQIQVVDDFSKKVKDKTKLSNKKEIRSLLSKMAFLINPHTFSLMDTYTKGSLWEIIRKDKKVKGKELDSYTVFIAEVNRLMHENSYIFKDLDTNLSDFPGSLADVFFRQYPEAFKRRVFDKYLWLRKSINDGKRIDNSAYARFDVIKKY
jgi:hypothetical protein